MFDPTAAARMARRLIHTSRDAALGTLDAEGYPHTSHVAVATLTDGSTVILISNLALHTQNLKNDKRASLLFVSPDVDGDTNTRARVTVTGTIVPVDDPKEAKDRFLRRHPDATMYADFADFGFYKCNPETAHIVAGFGRITDLEAADLLSPADAVAAIAAMDSGACEHMNEDHRDALKLMAEVLEGGPEGDWTAVAVDPLGIDIVRPADAAMTERAVRVEFDAPAATSTAVRMALVALTKRARAQSGTAAPA